MAWSSHAQGFFTGRYAKDVLTDGETVRVWYNDANFRPQETESSMEGLGLTLTPDDLAWLNLEK